MHILACIQTTRTYSAHLRVLSSVTLNSLKSWLGSTGGRDALNLKEPGTPEKLSSNPLSLCITMSHNTLDDSSTSITIQAYK